MNASPTETRPSVLLVDDVEANLVALEALLEDMNCELIRARSGNEALGKLLTHQFALMLLDVQMPGMDGFEVAKYARGNPATGDVAIIFLTAMHPTEESALHGYDIGAVDFLFKPINPLILRSKVRVFLDLYLGRKKLTALVEELEFKNKELDAFSYSVSHDLRAPLRAIHGFSRILLSDYSDRLDEQGRRHLEFVRAGAQKMSALIDDLLSLARVTRAPISRETINLSAVVEGVVTELRKRNPARSIVVDVSRDLSTRADPRLITILVENLIGNAWKFTATNPNARIIVDQETAGGQTVFRIHDNGAGFDMQHAQKLFAPFQRLHTDAEFEGTGIGLAIVERIVSRHGGKIWAEGQVDRGATFYFTLDPDPSGHGSP